MQKIFEYGNKEKEHISSRDKKMGEYIRRIGHIHRPVDEDLFASVVQSIIGQQVSMKAQQTIWAKMNAALGDITPQNILDAGVDGLQSFGTTFRKAEYIHDFAGKVANGALNLEALWGKSDEDVIKALSSLKGIGEWTAEMVMLFCMQRPNIFSFKDLAIHRGLRMVYRHRKITKALFEKYRRRFAPYGSTASLYLWEISLGAIPELKDCVLKTRQDGKNGKK